MQRSARAIARARDGRAGEVDLERTGEHIGDAVGRFAPSTTGAAHPGTLLAALLCWLDARSRGARIVLRLEDLDLQRSRPELVQAMRDDLGWLGLDWDRVVTQSERREAHEAALDRLAESGRLYPCRCSRSAIRAAGHRAPDGGFAYANTCRGRSLPSGGWRHATESLRVALPDERIEIEDESGGQLVQEPAREMGDPVVRGRDGGVAYQLGSVVDDEAVGVTRVVRGRDLSASTATQVALQRILGLRQPLYRHHLLLLEERGGKFAKLHGAVGARELRAHYEAAELCGLLAHAAGLRDDASPVLPRDLVPGFSWSRVSGEDRVMRWTGRQLLVLGRVTG